MTDETAFADSLVPIAARLVGTVRDFGPDDVAAVLDPLTPAQWYRLSIVLAAMVDPDARPSELLAWTTSGPVSTRPGFDPNRPLAWCGECGQEMAASSLDRHVQRRHGEAA